ncbi:hypothetical protein GCM10007964_51420 [Sphaerisporangium melleum]|uniref:Uncharacterized protein n=1 Tax=Sphaerisporangium melleum TaxID=321316 RepID=A0A917RDN9_9ACTN|nr:hypothetical protein GCM10007964_51420 [Sphaerisporangium melleum]
MHGSPPYLGAEPACVHRLGQDGQKVCDTAGRNVRPWTGTGDAAPLRLGGSVIGLLQHPSGQPAETTGRAGLCGTRGEPTRARSCCTRFPRLPRPFREVRRVQHAFAEGVRPSGALEASRSGSPKQGGGTSKAVIMAMTWGDLHGPSETHSTDPRMI